MPGAGLGTNKQEKHISLVALQMCSRICAHIVKSSRCLSLSIIRLSRIHINKHSHVTPMRKKPKESTYTHSPVTRSSLVCLCTFVVPFSLFMSVDGACHTSPSLAARSYACDWRTYVCSSAPPPHLFLFHSLVAFIDDHAVSLSTCGLALDECKLEQRAALVTTTPPPTCSSVERETKENASTTPLQTKRTTGGVFPELCSRWLPSSSSQRLLRVGRRKRVEALTLS